ncbi:hypothetical protein PR048_019746 [Dryococelus australis]|uniref:Uncharacterized protein n=1 Tax=Dryococelus australis TaxID=614101 RepID=A0ABQ9H4C7_9NEOP|nr:hypothetical protein PR048_019746 [Dryococelus australis]
MPHKRALETSWLQFVQYNGQPCCPQKDDQNHRKSGSLKISLGQKSILTEEREADLACRIVRNADTGLPVTRQTLRLLVYRFCE